MPAIHSTATSALSHLALAARKYSNARKKHGISGWAVFLIVVLVLVLVGAAAWIIYTRLRARRLGLPPPSLNPFANRSAAAGAGSNYPAPAPGGIKGWLDTQVRKFKNRRYATGAYEEPSGGYGGGSGARGRGGHGPLDPDEAWDSRVGHEAYYEEQELGLHAPATSNTAYGGATAGYGYMAEGGGAGADRGRSRTRDLDERYDEEMHGGSGGAHATNPFGDDHAVSMRGVSPRPLEAERAGGAYGAPGHGHKKSGSADSSPTERRSMFRENM